VRQGWFSEPSTQPSANIASSTPLHSKEEPLSPIQKEQPPIPVIANWFDKLEAVITKENLKDEEIYEKNNDNHIEKVLNETKTCKPATKDMLNEMFDSLVNEYNTMEILECSGETETMKRKKSDPKIEPAEIEIQEEKTITKENNNKSDSPQKETEINVIPPTPQTPKEIRKLFQEPANFERGVIKTDDLIEFREGVKGKVKESKESFLKQTSTENTHKLNYFENNEIFNENTKTDITEEDPKHSMIPQTPQTPKEIRKLFQEPSNFEREVTKSDDLIEFREGVKGKVRESRESFLKQTPTESSYQHEKYERKSELLQLINKPGQLSTENESLKKDLLLREERNRELEELCKRKPDILTENDGRLQTIKNERSEELTLLSQRKIEQGDNLSKDKTQALKEERKRELDELANRKVDIDWSCDTKEKVIKEERARELYNIANRKEEKMDEYERKEDEIMRQERAEELKQISTLRSQSTSEFNESKVEQIHEKQTMDDDLRGKVRNTAAAWKQREKSGSRDRLNEEGFREMPSRRIGSLLKNDPDYWSLDEPEEQDLPAPPPELSELATTAQNPPPPPRQSSRGKLEEYTRDPGWSAPWRK